jgi:GDPmannose 4,6-dehydratase
VNRKTALVIGAAGQDGSYLCELLLELDYSVVAVVRDASSTANLDSISGRIDVAEADLRDTEALASLVESQRPAEVYNFASVSFGPDAWSDPARTAELGTVALARLLETLRATNPAPRFFQASSSWVFGRPATSPQTERTPYDPVEPYGAVKAFGNFLVGAYRERYGLFACSGLFFNHESPRRQERFVTRKITRGAASVSLGLADEVALGDLDARRDWGYAKDYARAALLMLHADAPDDYVVATGESHSVREFAEIAFRSVSLDWERYVRVDRDLRRTSGQVADLVGDASAARTRLGWSPSVSFDELIRLMVEADVADLSAQSGTRSKLSR